MQTEGNFADSAVCGNFGRSDFELNISGHTVEMQEK